MGLVFFAFLTGNPVFIAIAVAVYIALWALFKKNKNAIVDYLERQAVKNIGEDGGNSEHGKLI